MDYKKLANLLYPNVTKDTSYYENLYKRRNLKENAQVTRIAPSPTGFLHIGTAYGAMIDKLTAGKDGAFYFRLEDTDKKREQKNTGTIAYEMLKLFNLKPNEGYTGDGNEEIGDYGPYVQSNRLEIYNTYAKKLVEMGKAFPCFCEKPEGKEEVLERRKEQLETNETILEKDPCRNLTLEEVEENLKNNKPFALRFKNEGDPNKTYKIKDLIKGEKEIRECCKDFVLIKNDGIPPYAFAHAIDDHLMGTTIVVRGEEWFPSLSSHLALFDALGFEHVNYAHTPVICKLDENGNKRKLSKRKDPEADCRYFIKQGYPINALYEYLLNLANSDFEEWRKNNPMVDNSEFNFSIEKVGNNNPMFDIVKINDISKEIISKMTAEEVYEKTLSWAKEYDGEFYTYLLNNKEYAINIFAIDRYTNKPRKDIAKFSEVKNYYSYFFNDEIDQVSQLPENLKMEDMKNIISSYSKIVFPLVEKQDWFNGVKSICEPLGFASDMKVFKQNPNMYKGSVADVSTVIRVVLTGRKNSPDLYEIIKLLDKKVIERFNKFLGL